MNPVVLIQRTTSGAAFRYSRFSAGTRRTNRPASTHIVELDVVPLGEALPHLSAPDVERFRTEPEKFLA